MTLFLLLLFHLGQDAKTRQQNTLQSVYNLQQLLPLQVFIVLSCFLNHALVILKKVHLHCYFSWIVKFLAVFMWDQLLMLLKQGLFFSTVITVVTAYHTDPPYQHFKVKLGGSLSYETGSWLQKTVAWPLALPPGRTRESCSSWFKTPVMQMQNGDGCISFLPSDKSAVKLNASCRTTDQQRCVSVYADFSSSRSNNINFIITLLTGQLW